MRAKRRGSAPRRRASRPSRPRRPATRARGPGQFVGRDPSPVLDRYPPKPSVGVRGPANVPVPGGSLPSGPSAGAASSSAPAPRAAPPPVVSEAAGPPAEGLIRLDRPFDVDEFAQALGETAIRLTVPSGALAEVLRRVVEFMGFGIYVYAISVRPAPSELLKGFVVELQRVEYDGETGAWKPFVERGAAPSPGVLPTGDGS